MLCGFLDYRVDFYNVVRINKFTFYTHTKQEPLYSNDSFLYLLDEIKIQLFYIENNPHNSKIIHTTLIKSTQHDQNPHDFKIIRTTTPESA